MKKYLIAVTMFFLTASSYAQLTVDSVGRVVIGDECLASNKLKVGDISYLTLPSMKTSVSSILKNCTNDSYNVSIYGEAYPNSTQIIQATAGVCGLAGGGKQGQNYGTIGLIYGSKNGAGIYGATVSNYDFLSTIPGRYAGYFRGNVLIEGVSNLNGSNFITNDMSLNDNIMPLGNTFGNTDVMTNILKIKTYEYTQKPEVINVEGLPDDSLDVEELNRLHFGFSAKEIAEIYPNLVKKNEDGNLSINYNEMIPLLMKSIQELQQEITELKQKYETK